ncbi:MAG: FemAB family PEP-CTERM system-associated protein [Burkholderiales bacterium]|nr:FemAB family PEP-CTERM system-associated protein [Burkholderiales bacterium]
MSLSEVSPALTVRPYTAADRDRWTAFVERCPEATFFHRIEWKDVIERAFRHRTHYLVAERETELVGVLPLAEVKSFLFGHSLASLPFCVYGGSAATDPGAAAALHAAARDLARERGASHLELRHREAKEPDWPRQDLYVTFRKEILPDVEANMLAIPRKQRAMVRKGIQRGLRAEFDASVDRFFALYADNVHRHGTPALPRRYFALLKETFGDACKVLTVVDPQGAPVSSVLTFYFRGEVLPYYAGDHERARELAANDFKYWALLEDGCERGYRVFDYGRSKQGTGSFDFKKNWGFEPTPLAYEYALLQGDRIPENNPLNPKYRAFIAAWRRLPIGLANALGPYIVRSLG